MSHNTQRTAGLHAPGKRPLIAWLTASLLAASMLTACGGGAPQEPPKPAAPSSLTIFREAPQSKIDYRATPYSARADCSSLSIHGTDGITLKGQLIPAAGSVPAHCRIDGNIPAEIGFQMNFPLNWNGRIFMYGNGGFAGEPADAANMTASREAGLMNGFATVRTDTGHLDAKEPLASFALNRPDKAADHAYRAVHETIVFAKKLAVAYYDRPANFAYWCGCSTGGRQGMMEASRYPEDFDGIMAGAPTLRWSDVMMKGLSNQIALDSAPSLTQSKLTTVFQAVLARCDAKDGVKDGLIADPRACDFDARRDLPRCSAKIDGNCFVEAEILALERIRKGPTIQGRNYFPQYAGIEHASTASPWILRDGGPNVLTLFGQSYMKYLAFKEQDPNYDWKNFNFDSDPARMGNINALLNPKADLGGFRARKGKILTYWGLADGALNPTMGLDYYDEISRQIGLADTQDFYRMFFIPGVAHCQGGYGPDEIDAMTPLIEWVEAGKAPQRLTAKKTVEGIPKYRRAYCPYPQKTSYKSGDTEDPANWRCEDGALGER